MNLLNFLSGFYTALSLASGIFFLSSRKLRAPFREAFGWMSVYSAVENLLCFIIGNIGISHQITRETICLCLDVTCIPLIFLVIATIVDQDMKRTPFRKRWMRVAIVEIPIILCMGVCAFTQLEWKEQLAEIVLFFYAIGMLSYAFYKLVVYEKNLPDNIKGKRASVKWTWILIALLVIEFVLYCVTGTYISSLTYYVVLIAFTCVATYFINKQSPIDTRQMFSVDSEDKEVQNAADIDFEQSGVSRKEMEEKAKLFMANHPKFKEGVAARAKQKLTVRDIFLCIMISEGKRVNEIAETLAISPASVEVARYRLRSKLNLNRGENLSTVIKSYL
ncbi:MAG: hypothetical protein KBT29_11870 [Prevotellaceae bacterium]|nr:hypothetical protein [Candidatus Minthosoma caballi]